MYMKHVREYIELYIFLFLEYLRNKLSSAWK